MDRPYRERIFSGWMTLVPGILGVAGIIIFVYSLTTRHNEDPFTTWFFLGISIFLFLVAINFSFLIIEIAPAGLSAQFGIFRHFVPADNIAGIYEDRNTNVTYGGFGVRFGWVNGKRRLVYNLSNTRRLVIQQKRESHREFVFSTRNPLGVIKAIQEITGLQPGPDNGPKLSTQV